MIIASNGRIMQDELERMLKGAVLAYCKVLPPAFASKDWGKTMKNLSLDSQSLDKDSNKQ
jgi:hypothetical protein